MDDPGIPTNAFSEILETRSADKEVKATTLLLSEEEIDVLLISGKLILSLLKVAINKAAIGNPESKKRFFLLIITRSES